MLNRLLDDYPMCEWHLNQLVRYVAMNSRKAMLLPDLEIDLLVSILKDICCHGRKYQLKYSIKNIEKLCAAIKHNFSSYISLLLYHHMSPRGLPTNNNKKGTQQNHINLNWDSFHQTKHTTTCLLHIKCHLHVMCNIHVVGLVFWRHQCTTLYPYHEVSASSFFY